MKNIEEAMRHHYRHQWKHDLGVLNHWRLQSHVFGDFRVLNFEDLEVPTLMTWESLFFGCWLRSLVLFCDLGVLNFEDLKVLTLTTRKSFFGWLRSLVLVLRLRSLELWRLKSLAFDNLEVFNVNDLKVVNFIDLRVFHSMTSESLKTWESLPW